MKPSQTIRMYVCDRFLELKLYTIFLGNFKLGPMYRNIFNSLKIMKSLVRCTDGKRCSFVVLSNVFHVSNVGEYSLEIKDQNKKRRASTVRVRITFREPESIIRILRVVNLNGKS